MLSHQKSVAFPLLVKWRLETGGLFSSHAVSGGGNALSMRAVGAAVEAFVVFDSVTYDPATTV
jgi:hypothetical protein